MARSEAEAMRAYEYLEAAKREELQSRLAGEGYAVAVLQPLGDETADLVATRNGDKVLVEVMAKERMAERRQHSKRLRQAAHEAGFTEYRLVVVPAPREADIVVDGLDCALLGEVQDRFAGEWDHRSSNTVLDEVFVDWIGQLHVSGNRTRVSGDASLRLERHSGGSDDDYDLLSSEYVPLRFDVELDGSGSIVEVHELEIELVDDEESAAP